MTPNSSKRRKLEHANNGNNELAATKLASKVTESLESLGTGGEHEITSENEDELVAPQRSRALVSKRPNRDEDTTAYVGGTYKSALFKLQVDELLAEVQPDYEKRLWGADEHLRRLKNLIENFEDRNPLSVLEATKSLQKGHKISIPFPDPKPDPESAYKLTYSRPSNINVVGSYALKTMVKSESTLSIDFVVVMPASIFQEKDYLNYRYFYKRAYYLACIAAGLQDSASQEFDLEFEHLHGNNLQPVLIVKPKAWPSNAHLGLEIRVVPSAPAALFAASKLRPDKNSIRPKTIQAEASIPVPTPFYNATIASDLNLEPYHKLLFSSSKQSSGFKEACVLGRIWLRQRGFDSRMCNGGFGHFEWATISALLIKGGGPKSHAIFSSGYSSYQMFKAMLQFISGHDLVMKPFFYDFDDISLIKPSFPMFYDGPRGQNILYKMTPWSYKQLQEEARASLAMFNDSNFDPFEAAFINRTARMLQRFDCIFKLSYYSKTKLSSGDHLSDIRITSTQLFDILQRGLMDRVSLIHIQEPDSSRWTAKSSSPQTSDNILLVAVVFDPANIDRLVDFGPPAQEKNEAAKFRKFWGEKAELRRFKDGSILESLVWSPGSTHEIFSSIIKHLVARHFGTETEQSLQFIGEGFGKLLSSCGASAKHFGTLKQAFKTFENQMRDLEGLPLQLRALSATDPLLRSSSIESLLFSSSKPMKTPANVLIQFEGSGRWPEDIAAIQHTKIAFLLKIGNLLSTQQGVVTTRVGLENETWPLHNQAFLDVFYDSGASFRLRIHNDREQGLLERQIKDKSLNQRDREEAVFALSAYKRIFLQLPLLTQSINTHSTRFPMLSPTIRLVKMWFSRHMILRHLREEFVELLVTNIFLQPYPWRAPSSIMTGFLRTLLFLSKWDWQSTPLIVDFSGTMTSEEVTSIKTRLEAWRKIDPGMNRTVIFAASNHDSTGLVYTDHGPSKMVASRITALARAACRLVKDKGLDLEPKCLFTTSIANYDFVIHLSPSLTGNGHRIDKGQPRFKNIEIQSEIDFEMIGYQPILSYLDELENLYGNHIVLFYDNVAGSVIAGLWNPSATSPRPFKVNMSYSTNPVDGAGEGDEEEIVLDKSAILAEIARLGGDMISRVDVHR